MNRRSTVCYPRVVHVSNSHTEFKVQTCMMCGSDAWMTSLFHHSFVNGRESGGSSDILVHPLPGGGGGGGEAYKGAPALKKNLLFLELWSVFWRPHCILAPLCV